MAGRTARRTYRIFYATQGEGPWPCASCDVIVLRIGRHKGDGNIHHVNEDPSDDTPENLMLLCLTCHRDHHPCAVETRAKMSATRKDKPAHNKGTKLSSATRAKIGAARVGKKHSPETRAKMRAAQKARYAKM